MTQKTLYPTITDYPRLPFNETFVSWGYDPGGKRTGYDHWAVDFGFHIGGLGPRQDAISPMTAKVVDVYRTGLEGRTVVLAGNTAKYTLFVAISHLSHVSVAAGQTVQAGTKVGSMGDDGSPGSFHGHVRTLVTTLNMAYNRKKIVYERTYNVHPLDHLYAYPNQKVKPANKSDKEIAKKPSKAWSVLQGDAVLPAPKMIKEKAVFIPDRAIKVRKYPDRVKGEHYTTIQKGKSVGYDSYTHMDGHVWISFMMGGERMFMAIRTFENNKYGTKWGKIV